MDSEITSSAGLIERTATKFHFSSLDEAISSFLLAKAGLTTHAVRLYTRWLRHFRASASGVWPVPIREITAFNHSLRTCPVMYAGRTRTGYSATSIHTATIVLRTFFKWTVKAGGGPNPMDDVAIRRYVGDLPYVPPVEDVRKIIRGCPLPRLKAAILLASHCGLRIGEIATLRWEHIIEQPTSYAPGAISLKQAKGGKGRTVRHCITVHKALAAIQKGAISADYIFGNGKLFTPAQQVNYVSKWMQAGLRELCPKVEVAPVTPHGLRRFFGTTLYRKTRDLGAVQRALGHSDIKTTMIYVRLSGDDDKKAYMDANVDSWLD